MAASMLCKRFVVSSTFKTSKPLNFARFLNLYPAAKTTEEEEEKVVEYPPIKPRYPPGQWGKMREKYAWQMYEEGERIRSYPRSRERLIELNKDINRIPKWKVLSLDENVGVFPYQQFITRTHVENVLPEGYTADIDQNRMDLISNLVKRVLEEEFCHLQQDHITSEFPPDQRQSILRQNFIRRAVDIIVSVMSDSSPHLSKSQVDTDVGLQACWRTYWANEEVAIRGDDNRGHVRFQSDFNVCKQLRTELPLPEFVAHNSATCEGREFAYEYSPKTIGQFIEKYTENRWLPGYRPGDPCFFTSVLMNDYSARSIALATRGSYGETEIGDMVKGLGLVTSFSSLVAQAHYLGFSMYDDLTYPLTTQTVSTDGQNWSFCTYQLNTLQLYKDKHASPKHNLCWMGDSTKLYEDIDSNGVVGFNGDALKNLVRFIAKEPVERENLRPNLSDQFNPLTQDFKEFFPYRPKYPRWCNHPEFLEGSVTGYV